MRYRLSDDSSFIRKTLVPVFALVLIPASAFAVIRPSSNGKIAFTSDRDGNSEIYVMNSDGSGQVRLTNNPGVDDFPSWSPDGNRIAFVSQDISGEFFIKVMNSDGSDQTDVTNIAFDPSPYPWHESWSLSWSPDGGRLAFEENADIFSVDLDGGHRTNLTNNPAYDVEPSWSPDGMHILFVSSRDPYITMHIMNADGSDVKGLPSAGEFWDMAPDWSPTGDRIAFVVNSEIGLPIIYTSKSDGSDRRIFDGCPTTGTCSTHRNKPKWSPDGTKLVFQSWEHSSDDAEIYVRNIDGTGFTQLTNTSGRNFHPSWQSINTHSVTAPLDFDGDGKTDPSIFRPSDGTWWYVKSSTGTVPAFQFGQGTDKIAAADFTGDGKTDVAFFRPSTGQWFVLRSEDENFFAFPFGTNGDIPMPADYDGDGKADAAVFRPSTGTWFILRSSDQQVSFVQLGMEGDQPIAADYDGDGKADVGIFRPNGANPGASEWWIQRSRDGLLAFQFGTPTDKAVPGDYTGDGKADIAFFRPSTGFWFVLRSEDFNFFAFPFGMAGDIPVPGDYDGDGKFDAAVFRPSASTWFMNRSTAGVQIVNFGLPTDQPVPNANVR